jgi:hypothetical protein
MCDTSLSHMREASISLDTSSLDSSTFLTSCSTEALVALVFPMAGLELGVVGVVGGICYNQSLGVASVWSCGDVVL